MKETIKNLKTIWPYLKSSKIDLMKCLICNLISIFFKIIVPIYLAKIIISITNNELLQILQIAILLFVVGIIDNFVRAYSHKFAGRIRRKNILSLQNELAKEILKTKQKTINKNGSGLFINRLNDDAEEIANVVWNLNYDFSNFIRYIGTFIAVLYINIYIFVFLLARYLITYYLEFKRIETKKIRNVEYKKNNDKINGLISEFIRGIADIKMLNAEKSFLKILNNEIEENSNLKYDMIRVNENHFIFNDSISDLLQLIFYLTILILLVNKSITAAIALILINYAELLENATYTLSDLLDKVKTFDIACERILPIIKGKGFEKEKYGNDHLDNIQGNFEFRNVYFKYTNRKVLENLSFNIKANQTIGFVGKSGAGKTTIFNLLCKLYDINEGTILIDGKDINELDKDSIRSNITIISQNPYIFNMSIKDNFQLVKNSITDKEIREACKKAFIDDYIMSLPNKYDTIVGEGGVTLSGGQRQRIAIARALIQNTKIILFDEATSALDNETQNEIQQAIFNMKGEYTILIIAHRLSTIINCDKIMVVDNGRIVGEGSHNQLLKNCEEYKKLYKSEINDKK